MNIEKLNEAAQYGPVAKNITTAIEDLVTSARLLIQFPLTTDNAGLATPWPIQGPDGATDVHALANKLLTLAAHAEQGLREIFSDGGQGSGEQGPGEQPDPAGAAQPDQGQVNADGTFITVVQFYGTDERNWPGYGQSPRPAGDFIWAPNAPAPDSPEWATAPWVWRPPLAA